MEANFSVFATGNYFVHPPMLKLVFHQKWVIHSACESSGFQIWFLSLTAVEQYQLASVEKTKDNHWNLVRKLMRKSFGMEWGQEAKLLAPLYWTDAVRRSEMQFSKLACHAGNSITRPQPTECVTSMGHFTAPSGGDLKENTWTVAGPLGDIQTAPNHL